MEPVKIKIRKRFDNHDPQKYGFKSDEETLTQQQFKDECNVNNILAKYKKTGMINHVNKHQGQFGDFSGLEDYQTSLQKLKQAQDNFETLPSELRIKFGNDPAKLIEFLADEKNNEDAYNFGLKIRPPKPEPTLQDQMENALENHSKKSKEQK